MLRYSSGDKPIHPMYLGYFIQRSMTIVNAGGQCDVTDDVVRRNFKSRGKGTEKY